MDMAETMTGGCQCGAVRYRAIVRDRDAYLCHCGMCRRATGGAFAALKTFRQADVAWDGEPSWYASSSIAERPFCARCGTPLGFRYMADTENMDLTIGSFDDPATFRPTYRFSPETALAGWEDVSHLNGQRLDEYAPLAARWEKAGGTPA